MILKTKIVLNMGRLYLTLKIHYQCEKLGLLMTKPFACIDELLCREVQQGGLLEEEAPGTSLHALVQTQTCALAQATHFMSHRDERKQLQLPSSIPRASEEQEESPLKCRAAVTFSLLGHCVKQM